ncbi:hypothetical protein KACHI17_21390 [Sediminibacterium sp. KACHI17]|uniref:Outer membrane protein beta-barrel domain-containing protein n=1 Tax=Sediminibacterium sp. KACHI17 TaxID=1751071 RepID=A0AAT9GKN3_9BACT
MNKKIYIVFFLSILSLTTLAQTDTTKSIRKSDAKDLEENGFKINTKVFKFGASLGFNYLTQDIFDPVLSPVDNSLKLQRVNPVSFLLSTTVIVNPISSYYRKIGKDGKPYGDVYSVPSRLSFIGTVNLAQFGASQTASFNKKIDGGLGLGIRLNNDFHLGISAEMISVRQLRDYIVNDFTDKPIVVNNVTLNALDISDNKLFVDKYYFGLSIKFIYVLVGKE